MQKPYCNGHIDMVFKQTSPEAASTPGGVCPYGLYQYLSYLMIYWYETWQVCIYMFQAVGLKCWENSIAWCKSYYLYLFCQDWRWLTVTDDDASSVLYQMLQGDDLRILLLWYYAEIKVNSNVAILKFILL